MRIYLQNVLLLTILALTINGCGTDDSNGESSSNLILKTENIQSKFTIELKVNNIATGKSNPYMVTYGIIDKSQIKEVTQDRFGIKNLGYNATLFSKNAGNNGVVTTACTQSAISPNDYVQYNCKTTLANGTKTSNTLILMMGKTYVLYMQNSFMWQNGISMATDEKFKNIREIKL